MMASPLVTVFPDLEQLSLAAATHFLTLAQAKQITGQPFVIALNGGGTPQRLFEWLGQPPYRDQIDWTQVHIFWGDERCVPPTETGSNFHQTWSAWLRHVPIPPINLYRVRGEMEPAAAAQDYAQQLQTYAATIMPAPRWPFPLFDLVWLGMGADGHTAALFPGPLTPAEETQTVISVNAVYGGRPARRVTLTPWVFNKARHIVVMATGEQKAGTVAAALYGPHQPEKYPIQRIQPEEGEIGWWLDNAAAGQLPA